MHNIFDIQKIENMKIGETCVCNDVVLSEFLREPAKGRILKSLVDKKQLPLEYSGKKLEKQLNGKTYHVALYKKI